MDLKLGIEGSWLEQLAKLYEAAGLGRKDEDKLYKAFLASFRVVTAWDRDNLCGAGRVISDGVFYASIFDVAVLPARQKRGIGRAIITALIDAVPETCIHLTSTFGNEQFYERLGFRRHKTAMAIYPSRLAGTPYLYDPSSQVLAAESSPAT